MPRKIAIVDDDHIFLRQITNYLNKHLCNPEIDFEIVKTVSDKYSAIELVKQQKIDLFLVDVKLNEEDADGITLVSELSKINKNIKIIMLTSIESEEFLSSSIMHGAIDYVIKKNYITLPYSIKKAFFEFNPSELISKKIRAQERANILNKLNESQRLVLLCMMYGKGIKVETLAQKVFIDPNTYYNYVSKIKTILKSYDWNILKSLFQEFEPDVKYKDNLCNVFKDQV